MLNLRKSIAMSLAALTLAGTMMVVPAQPGRHGHGPARPMHRGPVRRGGRGGYHRGVPPGYRGGYIRHNDWRRGYRLAPGVWGGGMVISNYGYYHLAPPPYGYQWRYIDGNYVLAAMATGIISSVIIGSMVR